MKDFISTICAFAFGFLVCCLIAFGMAAAVFQSPAFMFVGIITCLFLFCAFGVLIAFIALLGYVFSVSPLNLLALRLQLLIMQQDKLARAQAKYQRKH